MMQQYMKELEQEPFDAKEFVECLAWRTMAEIKQGGKEDFDPNLLHESFLQAIKDLTLLQGRQAKKCERLEETVRNDEARFCEKISGFLEENNQTTSTFHELDEKINHVAAKVLHLGDQLDNVNGPRSRVAEALKLMSHLGEFLSPEPLASPIFNESFRIDEAADVIEKLYIISQDLPSPKFDKLKLRIERKYEEIEKTLIDEFTVASRQENLPRMKEIAQLLSQFKRYSQCVDVFIEQSQAGCLLKKDVFSYFLSLSEYKYDVIKQVFNNPDQVMTKFILNIYQLKIHDHIQQSLKSKNDNYSQLRTIYEIYSKTNQLTNDLCSQKLCNDINFLNKLTSNIFNKYIENYIEKELTCLRDRNAANLQKYYDSKRHQKKQIQSGGFQDLRRDLQAVIGTRANINIAQIENYGDETFLSYELAVTILQDTKHAFQRCQLMSKPNERAKNAAAILDKLLNSLLIEHVDYALELGLQAVPIVESSKTPPTIYFFTVVHQSNSIIHLLEKQYLDLVVPLISNTNEELSCFRRKASILEEIEKKINNGLDRSINSVTAWVKLYLQAEQKKSDFRPEGDIQINISQPCITVCQYVRSIIDKITSNLDGNNVMVVLEELGIRFHRVIYEHLLQFQYNTAGATAALCDLNEFRSTTKPLGALAAELFDTLYALCNLLLVKPQNLDQVCSEDSLAKLDKSILQNFIQLRSDFKALKQNFSKVN